MHARSWHPLLAACLVGLITAGCREPTQPTPVRPRAEGSMATNGALLGGPQAVVVNPNAKGNGIAATIQDAIDRVGDGGQILIKPGTYAEALVIDKGVTLRRIAGEGEGPVVIAPVGAPDVAVRVATSERVVIQDVTLVFGGAHGVRGDGVVDVLMDHIIARAMNSAMLPGQQQRVIAFFNDAKATGGRAQVTLRESTIEGGVAGSNGQPPSPPFPQMFGLMLQGDITARVERNSIRQTGGACIAIATRADLGGETNADVVGNELDECYPVQGAGSLIVQALAGQRGTVTATGVVNIIGNTIRNSFRSSLPTTAITQMYAPGRIERNQILGVVQPGATGIATRNPAAIWIGNLSSAALAPDIAPIVRFNDIEGNAYAGLRIAPNIRSALVASCNWWGTVSGPAVLTVTSGDVRDAIVLETGAEQPSYLPFARAPIAATDATDCN
jgi:hypothetical protein